MHGIVDYSYAVWGGFKESLDGVAMATYSSLIALLSDAKDYFKLKDLDISLDNLYSKIHQNKTISNAEISLKGSKILGDVCLIYKKYLLPNIQNTRKEKIADSWLKKIMKKYSSLFTGITVTY